MMQGDELIYEAVVKDLDRSVESSIPMFVIFFKKFIRNFLTEQTVSVIPCSPLYRSRVVLRQLITNQAQRRGKRALEVVFPQGKIFISFSSCLAIFPSFLPIR